jgi:hypothetical protein
VFLAAATTTGVIDAPLEIRRNHRQMETKWTKRSNRVIIVIVDRPWGWPCRIIVAMQAGKLGHGPGYDVC